MFGSLFAPPRSVAHRRRSRASQEESNWPLAEGKVLKDKFDDIFAATKYTKALEAIAKLKKEQAAVVKDSKLKLETLKVKHEAAQKLRREITQEQGRLNGLAEESAELQRRCADAAARVQACEENRDKVAQFQQALVKHRSERSALLKENARREAALGDDLQRFKETLEELLAAQGAFEESMQKLVKKKNKAESDLQSKTLYLEAQREHTHKEESLKAKLTAEEEAQTRRQRGRQDKVSELSQQYPEIGVALAGAPTEPQVTEFRTKCHAQLAALRREVNEQKERARATEESNTAVVDRVSEKLAGSEESIRMKRQQKERHGKKHDELATQLQDTTVADSALEDAQRDVERTDADYERAKNAFNLQNYERELENRRQAIYDLNQKVSGLRNERSSLVLAGDSEAKLRYKRSELGNKKALLEDRVSSKRMRLESVLGAPLPAPNALKDAHAAALQTRTTDVAAKERELSAAQQTAASVGERVRLAERRVAQLKKDCADAETKVKSVLGNGESVAEYPAKVDASEKHVTDLTKQIATLEAMLSILDHYKAHADASGECFACKRGLAGAEVEGFKDLQEEQRRVIPGQMQQKKDEVATEIELQQSLGAMRQYYDQHTRLTKADGELAEAEQELESERDTMETQKAKETELSAAAATARGEAESVNALTQEVEVIDRLLKDAETLEKELAELQARRAPGLPLCAAAPLSSAGHERSDASHAKLRAQL